MPVTDNRFDGEHVAEEIEDLGESERDAVHSEIRQIIERLLKLAHSPAEQPRCDWMETILDARQTLLDKLTSTLKRKVEPPLTRLYVEARQWAALGIRRSARNERLPDACPFSWDEIYQLDRHPVSAKT